MLAELLKVAPKVGPLRAIDFKEPTEKTENLYFKSVDQTIERYRAALKQVHAGDLESPEINLDTGKPTVRDQYPLADATYRHLLDSLAYDNFNHMNIGVQTAILRFYDGFGFPKPGTRINNCVVKRWQQTWLELNQIRVLSELDQFDQPLPVKEAPATTARIRPGSCAD